MSITTKRGDTGDTSLYSGQRRPKSDEIVNACGDIDELVTVLGLAITKLTWLDSTPRRKYILEELRWIQKTSFVLASELATLEPRLSQLTQRIDNDQLVILTHKTKELEGITELPKGFILPGQSEVSTLIDMSRTISRRVERDIVRIQLQGDFVQPCVLAWVNRLSDFLYLLARHFEEGRYNLVKG